MIIDLEIIYVNSIVKIIVFFLYFLGEKNLKKSIEGFYKFFEVVRECVFVYIFVSYCYLNV